MLAVTRPAAEEQAAARDIIRRAKDADSRIRTTDELLVCAELALRAIAPSRAIQPCRDRSAQREALAIGSGTRCG